MFRQIVNWFNNLPVRYKLIGGFGLVALVPLLSLGLYTILTTTQTLEENEIETLTQVDALRAAEVEEFLLEREEELVAVSDFSSIDLLAASLTQQQGEEAYNLAVDAVAHDFLALANNLPFFDQIRYLSTDGVELVRVDRDPGQPAVTAPTAQLQDQADNAYFQEAASLPEGSVYISPVNLNREQGQIEEPFTPVLRMSTPVYDDLNGQFAGVLVFNVRADAFFTFLEAFENEQVYLVDSAGTFLLHPEEGARWAADLGHGTVLETQFPERAAEFLSTESGSLLTDSDLIVYETITVGAADNLELRLITTEPLDVVLAPVRQFRNASLAVAAVALAAAVGAGLLISGLITRQVDALDDLFRKVGMGDFAARAEVYSRDELGVAADGINRMLERLVDLLNQTNAERARLEASVTRLVNEVAGLASGDLSITVNAEDETTGAIAQALNFAINELNQIVYGVERAATDMTTASQSMGSAISTMVQQATSSADLADQAAETASVGDQAVSQTVAAMARIRENTQESARRIKRLGEVSQEISSAVRLIEEIADRTTVLALNASIQAAAAGEAGRGFAVVAEEVQRLAERASDATRDIENMVKNIQTETGEAVYAIEEATREVVEGSELAQQAGTQMSQLNNLVDQLAELVQDVSTTTAGRINEAVGELTTLSTTLQQSVAALQVAEGSENGRVAAAPLATD